MAETLNQQKSDEELVKRIVADLDENDQAHRSFVDKVDKRYEAWRGHLDETKSKAAEYTHKLHPPYLLSVADAVVANLSDDFLRFTVKPQPRMEDMLRLEQLAKGARANEIILQNQAEKDGLEEKYDAYALQNVVAGLTVGKCSWLSEEGLRSSLKMVSREVRDDAGEIIRHGIGPWRRPLKQPQITQVDETVRLRNDPTFEVRDVRDFFWPESATDVKSAPWLADRVYKPIGDLYDHQCKTNPDNPHHEGPCQGGFLHNVKAIEENAATTPTEKTEPSREQRLFNENRTKGLVEVLEYWDRRSGRVCTIANRQILLSDRPWPKGYYDYPFIVCSTTPDMFRIPGISIIERAMDLQNEIWTLTNQRLDNLELINNAVALVNTNLVDDPDAVEIKPRGRIDIEGPVDEAVKLWSPNPISAQISMPAEAAARGDIQNVTGGGPFLSGAESGTVDQTTATGVSIITQLAQRVVGKQKRRLQISKGKQGQQWLYLNQIYIRGDRLERIVGADGREAFEAFAPMLLQGDYQVQITASADSLVRAERRAEKQQLFQTAVETAQVMQAVGVPFNMKAFAEEWLTAYDLMNVEAFFSQQPAALGPPGSSPANPSAIAQLLAGGGGQEGPGGVTAQQSIAPEVSPSNQASISPARFMQRLLAGRGRGR